MAGGSEEIQIISSYLYSPVPYLKRKGALKMKASRERKQFVLISGRRMKRIGGSEERGAKMRNWWNESRKSVSRSGTRGIIDFATGTASATNYRELNDY